MFHSTERTGRTRGSRSAYSPNGSHWADEPAEPRDWKKVVLITGLGILSWVATYVGMLELIEANMGELPLVHKLIIGFSVGMLMTMIVWLLDQLFAPLGFFTKVLYALGYVFLTIISAGFGFGFYWKVLESRSEASRSAESAVGQVQGSLFAASTRLDQLTQTLDSLTQISRTKAETERNTGASCPASRPGDGPRRKLRDDDAARFSFAADFVKSRATQVKTDIGALDADLARIVKDDKSTVDARTGTRNEFMKSLSRKLDLTVTGFNAFRTDPQLKQIRTDLAERADKATFPDTKGATFSCPDAQLSTALKGVVRAIDGLPELEKPKIAAVEGSEATIEAFRRLTTTFFGLLSFKLPPSAEEIRELQKRAVQLVEGQQAGKPMPVIEAAGLSKRDYVPLAVALFVDLCLLLVSMGRPMNRLQGLVPKMREAERGPVSQILLRFSDIHRDEKIRESFEMLRHVVFDYAGAYYVAVPLDAPYVETRTEQVIDPRSGKARLVRKQYTIPAARREAMRVEAHLIGNLFASFEKDKVFKRVMWLSTDAARKRLARQGSKFASSEAFRVYRFADGAWSEVILGAVMGAARRVEAEREANGGEPTREPSFDKLADRMRQAAAEEAREPYVPQPKLHHAPHRAWPPFAAGQAEADPELEARFGPYAAAAARIEAYVPPPYRAAPARAPANNNTDRVTAPSPAYAHAAAPQVAQPPTPEADDIANVVPFKPQVRSAADEEAGEMRMPNIIARGNAALAADLTPLPSAPVAAAPLRQYPIAHEPVQRQNGVTVTATERRFSFSLPMGDTRLPQSLFCLATAAAKRIDGSAAASDAAIETATSEPAAEAAERSALIAIPPVSGDQPAALAPPTPTLQNDHRG